MTNSTSSTPRFGVVPAGRYGLDASRSTVVFHTRHLFGLAGVSGTMQVVSGEIVVDTAAAQGVSITVTISASSFDTGNARRDGEVRSAKFLNVEEYPELTLRAGPVEQVQCSWMLPSELSVRGTTEPLVLTVESVQATDQGFRARATARVDRYAFGLTAAKGMAARFLDIDLDVVAESS